MSRLSPISSSRTAPNMVNPSMINPNMVSLKALRPGMGASNHTAPATANPTVRATVSSLPTAGRDLSVPDSLTDLSNHSAKLPSVLSIRISRA